MPIISLKDISYVCKCKKCGEYAEVDTSVILTSNPPQYNYHCPHCGERGYVFCHDALIKYPDENVND